MCVENLTPFLKLLPCRDRAGVAEALASRTTLFGAPYVSMSTLLETTRSAIRGGEWRVVLTQTLTVALDRVAAAAEETAEDASSKTRLSHMLGLDRRESTGGGISGACAAARLSRVHAATHARRSRRRRRPDVAGAPREHSALAERSAAKDAAKALVRLKTWDLAEMDTYRNVSAEKTEKRFFDVALARAPARPSRARRSPGTRASLSPSVS